MNTYRVKKGDTLGKIARTFYGDSARFPLIVAANNIPDPDRLTIGQVLSVPDLLARTSTRPAALSDQRLSGLHPVVASRARAMLDLCSLSGLAILVTQGVRTWDEQDALFAKGRTIPPIGASHIVTKAKGGQSYHNFGLAFDIIVLDSMGKTDWNTAHPGWKRAAEAGRSVGLEWGGDWKGFKDIPHFQYSGGLSLAQCRSLFADGIEAVWERLV
ncbi:MAG TPA: M15 family metallopeptidase [Gemmatimonadales bacterium]|nr:M15 family metallopeptidase [Gemmatimonadales bacterium]